MLYGDQLRYFARLGILMYVTCSLALARDLKTTSLQSSCPFDRERFNYPPKTARGRNISTVTV